MRRNLTPTTRNNETTRTKGRERRELGGKYEDEKQKSFLVFLPVWLRVVRGRSEGEKHEEQRGERRWPAKRRALGFALR